MLVRRLVVSGWWFTRDSYTGIKRLGQALATEQLLGRGAPGFRQGATKRGLANELAHALGQLARIARRVEHRTGLRDLRGASGPTDDDRTSACHRLGNHEPERLGLDARMDDDVERSHRGGHVGDMAGEPYAAVEADARRHLAECHDRMLARVGLIDRVSDHVPTHGNIRTHLRERPQEDIVPLPFRERADQPDADAAARQRSQSGQRVQIE